MVLRDLLTRAGYATRAAPTVFTIKRTSPNPAEEGYYRYRLSGRSIWDGGVGVQQQQPPPRRLKVLDYQGLTNEPDDPDDLLGIRPNCPHHTVNSSPSPLHHAVVSGHTQCVLHLLAQGADPNEVDAHNLYPLEHAIHSSFQVDGIAKALLEHGAELVLPGKRPTHFLEFANNSQLRAVVRHLLEHGSPTEDVANLTCDVTLPTLQQPHTNPVPLVQAIFNNDFKTVRLLLLHCPNLHLYNNHISSIPHAICDSVLPATNAIQLFGMYHDFGGNLWVKIPYPLNAGSWFFPTSPIALAGCHIPRHVVEQEGELYKTAYDLLTQSSNGVFVFCNENSSRSNSPKTTLNMVQEELWSMMTTPMSLQKICRISIKRQIGRDFWRRVHQLPLPRALLDFVSYSDYFQGDQEDELYEERPSLAMHMYYM